MFEQLPTIMLKKSNNNLWHWKMWH